MKQCTKVLQKIRQVSNCTYNIKNQTSKQSNKLTVVHNACEYRMKNATKQHEKKMQHYFDNFTSIKNANCIAEKAQHPGKYIQKANTNIGSNHLCKNAPPGFKARSKPGQRRLPTITSFNCQAMKILQIFTIKKSTNQMFAVSRPSYEYV